MAEKSKDNESARHISMPENKSESNKRFLSQHKTSERCYRLLIDNLGQIDRAIKQETDIEQMPRTVLETVFAIFECDRVWILYPCDPEAASYRVPMEVYRAGHPGAKAFKLEVQMTPDKARTMKEALASEKPLMHGNVTGTRGLKEDTERFGVKSEMLKAIHPKSGKPWSFGIHQCSHARVWTTEEQNFFNEIGRRITDGLTSLLTLRKLKENEQQFRAVFEQAAVWIQL